MPLRSVTLVLTGQCNLRCDYCYARDRRPRAARWPVIRRSLDALLARADGPVEVGFTGGEPLLALSTLKRAVAHVEQRRAPGVDVRWTLLTNGLLANDDIIRYLDAHQFRVDLSFDGVEPAQALRGPASFPALDRLLDRLRDLAPTLWAHRLKVMFTVSPQSLPYLADSVEYFAGKGVPTVAIEPAMGRFDWPLDRIRDIERQVQRAFDTTLAGYRRTRTVPVGLFRKATPDDATGPSEWLCSAAMGENITVDVDGRVYGCVLASGTYQARTPPALRAAVAALDAGSLADQGVEAASTSMAAAAAACGVFQHPDHRSSSYGRCADCRFVGRCVVCPLAAACDPSCEDPRRVSDFICAWNQVALAARDAFPCQPGSREILAQLNGR